MEISEKPFDLTPDPKVLIALTHTPLKPLDALSELIDNSIDSFTLAENMGQKVEHPIVAISLPSRSEVDNRQGVLRIRDNGIGMSKEMAEKALKAGFTGNNPYDSLGLFGMGLNIATGKLGSKTTFITARNSDDFALRVVIDLVDIQESRSYEVYPEIIKKPSDFNHGTMIEISGWWPEGNSNSGFVKKLITYGKPKVRSELGRRYATVLRKNGIRIVLNDEPCEAFEHCTWAETRFVERPKHGKIFARQSFSQNVGSQIRCTECFAKLENNQNSCPVCSSESIRTINERVTGWVGIQRYDDQYHYGVDLIRNGRTIRILEQSAFFEFTDEFGKTIRDYPIDGPYGRIVGEIQIDHVPVDFMKQDFQRSSPEWQRAMSFLRGDSSLQPTQPGASDNKSPIYQLYQGYRRVRAIGRGDMYMGVWDEEKGKPKRIDRDTEAELLEKFNQKKPGYYDDSEWWRLVEEADTPPIENFKECPDCSADNVQSAELCIVCGAILKAKQCVNCHHEIAVSAISCSYCGESQIPEVEDPWACLVCGHVNPANIEACSACDSVRGTPNPLSKEYLKENSTKDESLTWLGCNIRLADGQNSVPIDVETYIVHEPMTALGSERRLPALTFKGEKIEVFLDKKHPLFRELSINPQEILMGEVAYFIHVANGRLSSSGNFASHTLANIQWQLLEKYCYDDLADDIDRLRADARAILNDIRVAMMDSLNDVYEDIFDELTEPHKKRMVENIIKEGEDISTLGLLKENGQYIKYLDFSSLLFIYDKYPNLFANGTIWGNIVDEIPDISSDILNEIRSQNILLYRNCLYDCLYVLSNNKIDRNLQRRARESVSFLQKKISQA